MNYISAVNGDVEIDTIVGAVLPHEHLCLDLTTSTDRSAFINSGHPVSAELRSLHEDEKLGLVVDQTCRGMGRNVADLQRISSQSGVPIVASTGWYYQKFHPENEPENSVARATGMLVEEIYNGIDGTQIRAGVIGEIGTHSEVPTPAESVSLRAAARASVLTGKPVSTHAHLGTGALPQLDLLENEGVDTTRVSIGHQDLCRNTDQHAKIAQRGAYVAFDTSGKESYMPDDTRIRLIQALCDRGFIDRILLSNDISRHGYLLSEGGQGYGHVVGAFRERLRTSGFTKSDLDLMYRVNPIRWLTGHDIRNEG